MSQKNHINCNTRSLHIVIEDTDGTLQFGNMNKENNTAAQ